MTKTTFGQIKLRQSFSTISEQRSEVYPNGVKLDFIKRTKDTAKDAINPHHIYGFKPNDVVWVNA